MSIIEVDGSFLEGGGQILRNALSLSCILLKPVRITKIRANRPNPGLSNQHLHIVNLLQTIMEADVVGNVKGSTELEFRPNSIKSGQYNIDTHTAASVTLIIQAVLPVLIFGKSSTQLTIKGGTNVGMAPQVDYLTEVLRPNMELFGVSFDFDLFRRGYYPRGGGCCQFLIPSIPFIKAAKVIQFGIITKISGWCYVAGNIPIRLAYDMQTGAENILNDLHLSNKFINIEAYKENNDIAKDNGVGLVLKAETSTGCTLGASALGEKKVDGYTLGETAATELLDYIKIESCTDQYVQDQLLLYMALSNGSSEILTCSLTNHTTTAIHVMELMLGVKFIINQVDENRIKISCHGIGYKNKYIN